MGRVWLWCGHVAGDEVQVGSDLLVWCLSSLFVGAGSCMVVPGVFGALVLAWWLVISIILVHRVHFLWGVQWVGNTLWILLLCWSLRWNHSLLDDKSSLCCFVEAQTFPIFLQALRNCYLWVHQVVEWFIKAFFDLITLSHIKHLWRRHLWRARSVYLFLSSFVLVLSVVHLRACLFQILLGFPVNHFRELDVWLEIVSSVLPASCVWSTSVGLV